MQKSATVALISNNKLLLLKRGDSAPWNPGRYCLPGGKLEDNETLIDCAVRELYEETNIVLKSNQLTPLIISYPKYSKTVFVCNSDSNYIVKLNWEHSDAIWVSYGESSSIDLVPGLSVTIKTLGDSGYLI
jgi:8-oxo-dGTP pyrophosphatase MutT (NUDIX family)